ncbi:hypothetical protein [Parahaliea aestuarii]|uniref:HD/PDEase domain-containing protein n=1 Tax=Parahaliea aestuarii TaxID=1852021 RepID=A0A5C8ZQU7_9GAMM|nr:hypothetical protein [Parahaliea aestuarii]TXS89711.1 hypothetical protein FVW59_17030 [Parahaliea aestuarii]
MPKRRLAHLDVTATVDVTSADAVTAEICRLFSRHYPDLSRDTIAGLVEDFVRLYRGDYPGFHACDVGYHDIQHVLDVTLAMVRLIDGHEHSVPEKERLGADLALAGLCAALFHDSGYIRRTHDTRHQNGAAYTRVHVSRSARWLQDYLPTVGLRRLVGPASRAVQFTNCSRHPDSLPARSAAERRLGELMGTADLIAQLSDANYVEKCRDRLFAEFVEGGLAGVQAEGYLGATYRTPDDLLDSTPAFIRWVIRERLEEGFNGAYHYAARHFGDGNPYMEAIAANYARLESRQSRGEHA